MSKRKKKRNIGMTEGAKNAMNDYGKQVFDHLDSNFRDPNDPHNITVQSLSTHFAKEGFKKGYDYGRREEREKSFNHIKFIEQFGREASELARKYGLYFHVSDVSLEASPCSHPCGAKVNIGIHCFSTAESVKQAYINWKDEK